jgi:hypothetical protein
MQQPWTAGGGEVWKLERENEHLDNTQREKEKAKAKRRPTMIRRI